MTRIYKCDVCGVTFLEDDKILTVNNGGMRYKVRMHISSRNMDTHELNMEEDTCPKCMAGMGRMLWLKYGRGK